MFDCAHAQTLRMRQTTESHVALTIIVFKQNSPFGRGKIAAAPLEITLRILERPVTA
jgi:hypothetical protein